MPNTDFKKTALLASFSAMILQSCSYHLPAFVPTSTFFLRITATDPAQYKVRFDHGDEYTLDDDGKLRMTLPAYRPNCSVYFLGKIRISGYKYPDIEIMKKSGKIVRTIAVNKINELPIGNEGYRILKVE